MTKERKISDDELIEIAGGVDGGIIDIDDEARMARHEQKNGSSGDVGERTPGSGGQDPETPGSGGGVIDL